MKKKEKMEPQTPQGNLYVTPLEEVLPSAMLPYAEFVILDRALPRVEDGLKPVQRRILYTMFEMGLMPDKPHKKSARIVGDCMGKYHPHGDSSVYDAMVRMAQDFNMGRTLVNGHGNFGSVDGDPAAAMRYTEARLEPLALELLRDLDKNTVSFSLNFDDSLKEPDMLPGRFPNLLVNGASGIAVGLATNIPPHNLSECIDGVIAYIDKPSMNLEEMMRYIPAPDFPTGGHIIENELVTAYQTGRGKITLRAKMRVENADGGKKNIIIYELPYQVNKANLMRRIAELKEEKKEEFACVTRITDESDRTGMRAVVEVRGDTDINDFLKKLYKYTDLETTFGMNMVAIAGGKPMQLGLLDIIKYYVNYQREVVLRRTKFDLAQAKERCHILEGLIVAVRNIDEVIKIIKSADSTADARDKLRKRFDLSERQAQAILDLRLARLTKLEVYKLEEELKRLQELIKELSEIVANKRLQLGVVKKELKEIRKKYDVPRKSHLAKNSEEAWAERKDIREPGVKSKFCLTAAGTMKCISLKNLSMSDLSVSDKTKRHMYLSHEIEMMSDENVFVFSNKGNCYTVDASLCVAKYSEKGFYLSDLFQEDAEKGEIPVAVFTEKDKKEKVADLLFFTKKGMVKKSSWSEYTDGKKNVFPAMKLSEDDELVAVEEETEGGAAVFITKGGMCLKAKKDEIPRQGRISIGVRGMSLKEDDEVIFASQTDDEGEIVAALSNGRFKRIIVCEIDALKRACKGSKLALLKEGEYVLFADLVTTPYSLAVETDSETVEISTELVPIDITASRGRALRQVSGDVKFVTALKYRQ